MPDFWSIFDTRPFDDPDNGRYDTEQPWIVWWFLTTDRTTRFTGRSRALFECCVCGERETITIRVPRVGPVPIPEGGKHVERLRFMQRHVHPDKPAMMAWAKPLRNPWANGGLNLDALAMRLEADIREAQEG